MKNLIIVLAQYGVGITHYLAHRVTTRHTHRKLPFDFNPNVQRFRTTDRLNSLGSGDVSMCDQCKEVFTSNQTQIN